MHPHVQILFWAKKLFLLTLQATQAKYFCYTTGTQSQIGQLFPLLEKYKTYAGFDRTARQNAGQNPAAERISFKRWVQVFLKPSWKMLLANRREGDLRWSWYFRFHVSPAHCSNPSPLDLATRYSLAWEIPRLGMQQVCRSFPQLQFIWDCLVHILRLREAPPCLCGWWELLSRWQTYTMKALAHHSHRLPFFRPLTPDHPGDQTELASTALGSQTQTFSPS